LLALLLAGKGGEYIGPPYLGLLALSSFNTSRITPLNPAAHSAFKCRCGKGRGVVAQATVLL
jgi:hypothetical protein